MTLRELAGAATPGPWKKTEGRYGEADVLTADGSRYVAHDHEGLAMACSEADAAYIAAASPDVVLALLDRLDALEKALAAVVGSLKENNRPNKARWLIPSGGYGAFNAAIEQARAALTAEVAE